MTTMGAVYGSTTTGGGWVPWSTVETDPVVAAWSRGRATPSRDSLLLVARKKISTLTALEHGWDGEAGEPTGLVAAMVLNGILLNVTTAGGPTPQIAPLSDGGVEVLWLVSGTSIEIVVDALGAVSVLGNDDKGNETFEAEYEYYQPGLVRTLEDVRAHLEDMGRQIRARISVI